MAGDKLTAALKRLGVGDTMGGRGARSGLVLKSNSLSEAAKENPIKELIAEGERSTRLSFQEYQKHVLDSPQYKLYRESLENNGKSPQSILYLSFKETQELIDKYAGTAPFDSIEVGASRFIEYYDADSVIGAYYNKKDGGYVDTTRFAIHYAKNSAHVVPVKRLKRTNESTD